DGAGGDGRHRRGPLTTVRPNWSPLSALGFLRMSLDDAFLRDICERPDDDAPRLIYADWLEENGHAERAEFIRLQCRVAQMDEDDPHYAELEDREFELLHAHSDDWQGAEWDGHINWVRGFMDSIRIDAGEFLHCARELLRLGP